MVTVSSDMHPAKALPSMASVVFGSLMLLRPVQPVKAPSAMAVTVYLYPLKVTLAGIYLRYIPADA